MEPQISNLGQDLLYKNTYTNALSTIPQVGLGNAFNIQASADIEAVASARSALQPIPIRSKDHTLLPEFNLLLLTVGDYLN